MYICWFKKRCCELVAKVCACSTGWLSVLRSSVSRLTDRRYMAKVLLLQCTKKQTIPIKSVVWGVRDSSICHYHSLTPSMLCSIFVGPLSFRGIRLFLLFTSMCGIEWFAILIRHSIYRSIYPSATNPSAHIYPPHLPIYLVIIQWQQAPLTAC